jgi:hypothetical protein
VSSTDIKIDNVMKQFFAVFFVVVFCASVSTYEYFKNHVTVCDDCEYIAVSQANSIFDGTAQYPFIYRVLTPVILKTLGGSIFSIAVFHLLARVCLLGLLYMWVERWNGNALASIGIMSVVFSIMSYTWYESYYSLTEGVILLSGWLLLVSNRLTKIHYVAFGVLVVLGSLNRETTGFILVLSWVVLYAKQYKLTAVYVALGVGVFVLLRWYIAAPSTFGVMDVLSWNMTGWRLNGAIGYNAVLLPLWLGIVLHGRDMPTAYKRLLLLAVPYVVLFVVFGVWQEIRLLIPVVLLVMPFFSMTSPIFYAEV